MRKSRQHKPYEDYRSSEAFKKISRQRWRYNILGLVILMLILFLAGDVGGCAHWLGSVLGK
ncbi:MAG: hypothetical protein ACOX0F_07465 [Syntrophomonadaceae bacterium]|jgi:hypothetical protein